jgi:hypothetical protein
VEYLNHIEQNTNFSQQKLLPSYGFPPQSSASLGKKLDTRLPIFLPQVSYLCEARNQPQEAISIGIN